jgi:hypothetical protein
MHHVYNPVGHELRVLKVTTRDEYHLKTSASVLLLEVNHLKYNG